MTDRLARRVFRMGPTPYLALKDPCPVQQGERWHLFGTGVTTPHAFELLHAVADGLEGPWRLLDPVDVSAIDGTCTAAPGVVADRAAMHMFLQTDYNVLGGRIEHLVSTDGGRSFDHSGTALTSVPGTDEGGIYDPHPAVVWGRRWLVYSAFSVVGEPQIHVAVSETDSWHGPWLRLGAILRHEDVACHNQPGARDYEWGLEGAQLVELPDGRVLLNTVCFLPGASPGCRQRVVFALGDTPLGPFDVIGPVLPPDPAQSGENGHATVLVHGDELHVVFQERPGHGGDWHYALASGHVAALVTDEESSDAEVAA